MARILRSTDAACAPARDGSSATTSMTAATTRRSECLTTSYYPSWPGFVPAIHVLLKCYKEVDARHKAGHDEGFTGRFAHAFLRETNALKAATASVDRIRSPNRWPSWSIRRVRSSGGSRKSLREIATASAGSAQISRATLRASA